MKIKNILLAFAVYGSSCFASTAQAATINPDDHIFLACKNTVTNSHYPFKDYTAIVSRMTPVDGLPISIYRARAQ